jgi:hypothetical protein
MMDKPLEFWLWTITDPFTNKRRQISYRMSEATARKRFGKDALKVEGSLEVRHALSDFLRGDNAKAAPARESL